VNNQLAFAQQPIEEADKKLQRFKICSTQMLNMTCLDRFLVKHFHLIIKAQFRACRDVFDGKKSNSHDTPHVPFLHFTIGIAAVIGEAKQVSVTRCIDNLCVTVKSRNVGSEKSQSVVYFGQGVLNIIQKPIQTSSGPSCSK
jgi:hypothetical protein